MSIDGAIDGATWQALGLILTLVGLGLAAVVWRRKGPAKGLRAVAWSLLPLAAGLTGVLRLGSEIADAVLSWAGRLVFSPVVWLGLVVTACAAVLFVVSGWMMRRTAARTPATAQVTSPAPGALPSAPTGSSSRTHSGDADDMADDMADVEEILRRHGIS
jgi:hypothetical protein